MRQTVYITDAAGHYVMGFDGPQLQKFLAEIDRIWVEQEDPVTINYLEDD